MSETLTTKEAADQKRNDELCTMVQNAIDGSPAELIEEIDAIYAFLRLWSEEYGEENKPRLALVTGMTANLALIFGLYVALLYGIKDD